MVARPGLTAWFAAASIIWNVQSAHAQSPAPARVDYVAPISCPDRETFITELKARARRVPIASSEQRTRRLTVEVTPHGNQFLGRMSLVEVDGSRSKREVDGRSCGEVVAGLALIGAFALDPDGLARETKSTGPGAENDGGGEKETSPLADRSTPRVTKKPAAEKPDAVVANSPPGAGKDSEPHASRATSSTGAARWQLSFGAQAELIIGVTPALGTVPIFVEVARMRNDSALSPSARVRFERPGSDAGATSAGNAHFRWTEASLDVCPVAISLGARVRLRPCLRTEVGVVEATGVGTDRANTATRPSVTLGALAISRWTIAGPLFVEIEMAVLVPVIRDRFFLDPQNTTVFRPSVLGLSAASGVGLAIW